MSKAVLVMDMPSSCIKCPLYDYVPSSCFLTDKFQNNISDDFKPGWCPLIELPEKKERLVSTNDYDGGYSHGFTHGYNACIDELLGEENGSNN